MRVASQHEESCCVCRSIFHVVRGCADSERRGSNCWRRNGVDTDPEPRPTHSIVHPPGASARKCAEALSVSTQREPRPAESGVRSDPTGPGSVSSTSSGRTCLGLFDGQSRRTISKYVYGLWIQNSGLLSRLPEVVSNLAGHNIELAEGGGFPRTTITEPTGHSCRPA